MMFPLTLEDASLLLATLAIVLLITSELLPHYGRVTILVNKKRLRNVGAAVSILFLITVAIRIVDIIVNSLQT
jgi:uncharacterized membrane protein